MKLGRKTFLSVACWASRTCMGARLSNAANTACCRVLPPQLGRHYRSSDGAMAIGATWTASGRRKQL